MSSVAKQTKQNKKSNKSNRQNISLKKREIGVIRQSVRSVAKNMGKSTLEAKIAESMCLPGEQGTTVYRWADGFSAKRTALAHPYQTVVPSFGQAPATYGMIGQFEQLVVATRNPFCSLISYDQNSTGKVGTYLGYARGGGTGSPTVAPAFILDNGVDADVQVVYALPQTVYTPHGPALFAGSVSQVPKGRFLWFDVGTTYSVTVTSSQTGKVSVMCDYWGPNGFAANYVDQGIALTAGTPQIFNLKAAGDPSGYYSLRVRNETGVDNVTLTVSSITLSVTSSVFCHLAAPSLWSTIGSIKTLRVLAHSLKITDTAAYISRSGRIIARQFENGTNWQTYIQADSWSHIALESDYDDFEAATGCFGFLKPTQPSDLSLFEYHIINDQYQIVDCFYPIDKSLAGLVMCTKVADAASASFKLVDKINLEFETVNQFYDTEVAQADYRAFNDAINLIREVPQFHENPLHMGEILSKIGNFIRGAAEGFIKYAPLVTKVASALV